MTTYVRSSAYMQYSSSRVNIKQSFVHLKNRPIYLTETDWDTVYSQLEHLCAKSCGTTHQTSVKWIKKVQCHFRKTVEQTKLYFFLKLHIISSNLSYSTSLTSIQSFCIIDFMLISTTRRSFVKLKHLWEAFLSVIFRTFVFSLFLEQWRKWFRAKIVY